MAASEAGSRVAIATLGSRGDLQPFVALALALHEAGIRPTLLFHDEYRAMLEPYPFIGFHHLGVGPEKALMSEAGQAMVKAGPLSKAAKAREFNDPMTREWVTNGIAYYTKARPDFVVLTTLPAQLHSAALMELKIPFLVLHLGPFNETSAFAPPVAFGDGRSCLPVINRVKWSILRTMSSAMNRPVVNKCMTKAGLPPLPPGGMEPRLRASRVPVLMAYISDLCPPPSDWPDTIQMVGPLMMPPPDHSSFHHPQAEAFLARHKENRPIYIGFGSMLGVWRDDASRGRLLKACLRAASEAGVPVVLCTKGVNSWAHRDEEGRVLVLDAIPHTWLFPQVQAVVCHGGIGTVNAALHAGKPLILAPADIAVTTDQPFWAGRLPLAGLGSSVRNLGAILSTNGRCLRRAIADALRPEVRQKAEAVGQRLRQEEAEGRAGIKRVAAVVAAALSGAAAGARA